MLNVSQLNQEGIDIFYSQERCRAGFIITKIPVI